MKQIYKAFDIETMPNLEMVDLLPEPDVKYGNTKDEDKRLIKYEDAVEKQIEKMGLNPLYSRIISYAFVGDEEYKESTIINAFTDKDESDLIRIIFNTLKKSTLHLYTWNGKAFDLPFLYKRALILNIDILGKSIPKLQEFTKRYNCEIHTDLMLEWGSYMEFAKLNDIASILIGQQKEKLDHKDFQELIVTPEGRKHILNYNEIDARLTYQLGCKMKQYLF